MKKYIFTGILLATTALPLGALAHERDIYQIGSKSYQFIVGSLAEPLLVDDKTGVDFTVNQIGGGGVAGLEKTLKVEISAGSKKKVLDLEPAWNKVGAYAAVFIPTVATTYSYRFFGTVNNVPVNLTFTCMPAGMMDENAESKTVSKISDKVILKGKIGGFGCPESRAGYGFPESVISNNELTQKMDGLTSSANIAKIFGIAGVFLAALALGWSMMAPNKTKK